MSGRLGPTNARLAAGRRASPMRAITRAALATLVSAVAVAGCGFEGVHSLPLPGGVATGPDAYSVTAEFADVTDLVPRAAVKVNDVTVGTVEDIRLDGWHAEVICRIKKNVRLPDNAVARVAQTSLLGEKYVSISRPADQEPIGRLSGGDVIPLSSTGNLPEVEEVLSALSLLLNGGGLEQIQTISREVNAALSGREDRIRSLLRRLDTFVGALDEQKAEVVRTIDALDRLSMKLKAGRSTIDQAIVEMEPSLDVLARQRADLTKMLVALSDLGEVSTRVINASRDDMLANLRALDPILARLADAGDDLPKALELLLTYPFPHTVDKAIHGDYVNLYVTMDVDLQTLLNNLVGQSPVEQPGKAEKKKKGPAAEPRPSPSPSPGGDSLLPGSGKDDDEQSDSGEDESEEGGLDDLLTGGRG